ncbi:MAG TPA: isovaleryl-CoA dehydrogenase [Candidatus Methylomirabilis sp.]|nr:isovaleryl-CoA dehydrogenase [Candidatus Methylomirabilis sp.]
MKPTDASESPSVRGVSNTKTHEVLNQPPPLTGYNLYLSDVALVEAVQREGADWATAQLNTLGKFLGTEEAQLWGFEANENEPVLHTHDRFGNRRDEVEFHPSWHGLMRTSIENRLHSLPWVEQRRGAHVARAALLMLAAQNEMGHICPISMTFSAVAVLRAGPALAAEWEPRILSSSYDPRFLAAPKKSGVLVGMGMTEKQGGSDVRANTTLAERMGNSREYLITGHKWFCSAPMCDAFLVLAQAPKGLSCFLLPRWTPDGERNAFHIQRLKRKMGNRSNASSEVEFARAWARLIGEEGRGVHTIIEMVNCTRLDCATASAGLMRAAVVQAVHHAKHRKAFGKLLIEQPLMKNVLADLIVESEAATLLMVRVASAFDGRASSEQESAFARIATAIAKYWLCKRAPVHVGEALECLGGNGYVEESVMPRLYCEAPLYSIWEGAGNVICLDVLRTLAKEPLSLHALLQEIRLGAEADKRLTAFASKFEAGLRQHGRVDGEAGDADLQKEARRLTESAALLLQGSLLARCAPSPIADAFIASRLAREGGLTFGTLPGASNVPAILGRVSEHLAIR